MAALASLTLGACAFDTDVGLLDEDTNLPPDKADEEPQDPASDPPDDPTVPPQPPTGDPVCIGLAWDADFDIDPRADLNQDGQPDFVLRGPDLDDELELDGGMWFAPPSLALETFPPQDFRGLTSIQLSMRPAERFTTSQLQINVDHEAGSRGVLFAEVEESGFSSYRASVYALVGSSTALPLAVTVINAPFADFDLVVDGNQNTVSVVINQIDLGEHSFPTVPAPNGERVATLVSHSGATDVDYLHIQNCANL